MFIKRLVREVPGVFFDVFIGNGWDNWTRVRRNHWGVSVVAGNRISKEVKTELNKRLVK